jgi:regulator of protease activity HflC (stomatin/prohibitin superfamily)
MYDGGANTTILPARGLVSRGVFYAGVIIIILALLLLLLWPAIFYRIGPGERGVRWTIANGTRLHEISTEGLTAIPPWDALFIYDTRVRELHEEISVLTVNGLPVTVTFSGRYQPVAERLPSLHQTFGPQYEQTLVRPEMISAIRTVVGAYLPEELYARSERELVGEIHARLRAKLEPSHVRLHDLVLTRLRLTPQIEQAINEKLAREQQALAYPFRLRAEASEADRKRIEAQGIRDFERRSGISIVKWRGLEVTGELARSPNAKLVIVGGGSGQMPLVLGDTN